MGRKLVFHLYTYDGMATNSAYKVNQRCLKDCIQHFDKMLFVLSVNDLNNKSVINDGINWVMDTVGGREVEIKIQQNTPLCESKVLKDEVIDKLDTLEDLIYFGHIKGAMWLDRITEEDSITWSGIVRWICGLYYFNFIDINEMEEKLYGIKYKTEMFYGTFLCYIHERNMYQYIGTHYWLNPMEINRRLKTGECSIPNVYSRYFAEDFPGIITQSKHELWGDGLSSHKDVSIDGFNLYTNSDDDYARLSEIMGEPNFMQYSDNIIKEIFGK